MKRREHILPATIYLCIGWPTQLIFRQIMEWIYVSSGGFSQQTTEHLKENWKQFEGIPCGFAIVS